MPAKVVGGMVIAEGTNIKHKSFKIKEEAIYFNTRMADDGIHIGAKVSIKIINQYSEFKAK